MQRAESRLADLIERARNAPDAQTLLPHLEAGAFHDLLLAIADHSPFLWQLALAQPARLARCAGHSPEAIGRDLVAEVGKLFRRPGITQAEAGRDLRKARALHALTVALADIGGAWSVDEVTRALSAFADACV
ncbi:MAG TPA: bifunctional [glutamine synthetase] adenylyltransferase/[glutamine synthetase]-adenylyl-L-tyrosine phosphorylase, partial [Beijerinckiaceae bacterium]|nr:bifunctional [glutamine synthetase] adenylyltransferase/[glutamine synthetase]-adenylyl-L-tyrosine phosphorylase [Beijerinckiaceae bacterium]